MAKDKSFKLVYAFCHGILSLRRSDSIWRFGPQGASKISILHYPCLALACHFERTPTRGPSIKKCMILASTESIYGTLCGLLIQELVRDAVSEPFLLPIAL